MILAHSFPVALAMRELTINQDMKALRLAVPDVRQYVLRCCTAVKHLLAARDTTATNVTIHRASRWHSAAGVSAVFSGERNRPPGKPVAYWEIERLLQQSPRAVGE
jgi:hypothetical protein